MYRILKTGFLFFLIFLVGLVLIFLATSKIIDKDCLLLENSEQLVIFFRAFEYSPA
mgnify:CR=1 FL=1